MDHSLTGQISCLLCMHMILTSPFIAGEADRPTRRQRAIAALIQRIWDRTSQVITHKAYQTRHPNWDIPQSKLPPPDRWANLFTAFLLDRWVNAFVSRSGGLESLAPGSHCEKLAAQVLFMLWSIARFGAAGGESHARRKPSSLQDIPADDIAQIDDWLRRSLVPCHSEFDRQFGEAFLPTFNQNLIDKCIVRAVIGCQYLTDEDLTKIIGESDIDEWADRMVGLETICGLLRRMAEAQDEPTILITGPTTTRKSAVAWELAQSMNGVAIAADPFHICAIPPVALGVGLPAHMPPPGVRTRLYRRQRPEHDRPAPHIIVDWIATALDEEVCHKRPRIIEGGSISVALALWERGIPTHVIAFQAEPSTAKARLRARMAADSMSSKNLMAEARAVRESDLELTWVVQESAIFPKVFDSLDGRSSPEEMMDLIEDDWHKLTMNQQQWFADLRVLDGVLTLPSTRHTADNVRHVLGF